MTQAIEETIKALKEFELDLDKVKAEAADAKTKLLKDAGDWADAVKREDLQGAQRVAELRLEAARAEGEREVESIKRAAQASLQSLKETLANHKTEAVELVVKKLLGVES